MRYIQDPITLRLVPSDEYVRPQELEQGKGPYITPDIQPYRSIVDGSMITSRSKHREHLKRHNCIEVGNEKPKL